MAEEVKRDPDDELRNQCQAIMSAAENIESGMPFPEAQEAARIIVKAAEKLVERLSPVLKPMDGMVMVPREPTWEMREASRPWFKKLWLDGPMRLWTHAEMDALYKAMIASWGKESR